VQVIFIVIDQEIFSTVIRIVPLLWYVQMFQFLAKVKATSTGKLLDNLSRSEAVAELYKFNEKLPTPLPSGSSSQEGSSPILLKSNTVNLTKISAVI
jgi:hypothetical protein